MCYNYDTIQLFILQLLILYILMRDESERQMRKKKDEKEKRIYRNSEINEIDKEK